MAVLSSVVGDQTTEIMGYIDDALRGQNTIRQNLLEEEVLPTSNNGVNYSDKPHQHPHHFIFTTTKGR